jgi:hypothetical protein
MRTSTLFATLFLIATVIVGGALLAPAFAQLQTSPSTLSGAQWLTVAQIHDRVEAAGYREIEKIEREDRYYEVKASTADGRRVELYLDPVTAEVTSTKYKDERRDKRSMSDGERLQAVDARHS